MNIQLIAKEDLERKRAEYCALLRDAVENGASLGFILPLPEPELVDYWHKVGEEMGSGKKVLLAALTPDGRVIGSVQLALELRSNGRHRAEVQKLIVLSASRGKGIGAALMARLEDEARKRARRLLFLDTSSGAGGAVRFYERLGYQWAGSIPDYAADPDGKLTPNMIFYRKLT